MTHVCTVHEMFLLKGAHIRQGGKRFYVTILKMQKKNILTHQCPETLCVM
jgi:hypothetical protein